MQAETSTLQLFVPDPNARGVNPQWLRIKQEDSGEWKYFAQKYEVFTPGPVQLATVSQANIAVGDSSPDLAFADATPNQVQFGKAL